MVGKANLTIDPANVPVCFTETNMAHKARNERRHINCMRDATQVRASSSVFVFKTLLVCFLRSNTEENSTYQFHCDNTKIDTITKSVERAQTLLFNNTYERVYTFALATRLGTRRNIHIGRSAHNRGVFRVIMEVILSQQCILCADFINAACMTLFSFCFVGVHTY